MDVAVGRPAERDRGSRCPTAVGDSRLRRVADVTLASALLVVTLPLLALSALAVLVSSGRPVFYGHERVGRDGATFRCWKLRTMRVDAEARLRADPELHDRYVANGYKLPPGKDPRVTRVGDWLRRSYLDELPQLFNVIGGSMSLIGPRPVVREELEEFQELEEFGGGVELLLSVRPGIFGAWTSRGHHRPHYPERARLELDYLRSRSLRRDVVIMARSLPVVLRGYRNGV